MREAAAREGKSVDELTEEAAKHLLSQRLLEKFVPFPTTEPNPARRVAESFETGYLGLRLRVRWRLHEAAGHGAGWRAGERFTLQGTPAN